MAVREWLNKNRKWSTAGAMAVAVIGIGLTIYQLLPEPAETKAWFTTDDGKTWFKDSNRLVPPFQRDGKEAVLAKVYECTGKPFVAYMLKYTPEGKAIYEKFYAAEDAKDPNLDEGMLMAVRGHARYKRPGEAEWTPENDIRKVTEMFYPKCPDGSAQDPLVVWP
jgi:hypothetical protein